MNSLISLAAFRSALTISAPMHMRTMATKAAASTAAKAKTAKKDTKETKDKANKTTKVKAPKVKAEKPAKPVKSNAESMIAGRSLTGSMTGTGNHAPNIKQAGGFTFRANHPSRQ